MLNPFAPVLRRYRPASRRSVDSLRGQVDGLAKSVAALRKQGEEILKEVRATNNRLAELALRESQLRAILHRDAVLDDDDSRVELVTGKTTIGPHVAMAIQHATLQSNPFPYAVVDDLLPLFLYRALMKGIPPVELFADRPANKQQMVVPFDLAPRYARRVWRFMTDVVVPDFILPSVLEKFHEPLTEWMSANWPHLDPRTVQMHCSNGRILLRTRGYRIPPHRDPKWGFITCLFYLARPQDSDGWGTQVYSVESDEEAKGVSPHWIDPSRCRLVADIGFRPNRAFIFLNSTGAHGSQIPDDAEPEALQRYAYQFRIGPTPDAVTAVLSTLSAEKRAAWAGKFGDY